MSVVRLMFLIVVAVGATILIEWTLLDRLTYALIALCVFAFVWSRRSLRGLALTWNIQTDRAQVGQVLADSFSIKNTTRFPKLWVEIRDRSTLPAHNASRVVHLRGRESSDWSLETVCVKRGRFHVGPLVIRSGDPFGLFPSSRIVDRSIDLLVYPPEFELRRFVIPTGTLTGASATERRTPIVTPSVAGIREYASGDAFNRISWSATARLNRLMVKEFEIDPTSDVWIVLDLDSDYLVHSRDPVARMRQIEYPRMSTSWLDSTEDYAVAVTASLAKHCLDAGRGVGLIASGSHLEVIPAERSERMRVKILETLAVVSADGRRPLAELLVAEWRRFRRHSGLIVVTSSNDPGWVDALAHIASRRVHVTVIVIDAASFGSATPAEPMLKRLAASGIPTYIVRHGSDISSALANPTLGQRTV